MIIVCKVEETFQTIVVAAEGRSVATGRWPGLLDPASLLQQKVCPN